MTQDEIKARLYDLRNAMDKLSDRQHERWRSYQDLEKKAQEAKWLYDVGTYDVSDVHKEIKELERQLEQ